MTQHSLTRLEDRYRKLREIGQKRFEAWEAEKVAAAKAAAELKQQLSAQSVQTVEAKQARDQQAE